MNKKFYRYTRDDMFVGGVIEVQSCPVQIDDNNQSIYTVPGISVTIFV